MPKKKKTRQQKIVADKRRETNVSSLFSLPLDSLKEQVKQPILPIKQTVSIATTSYTYLSSDLRKTMLFMSFVVLIEIALKFFIK